MIRYTECFHVLFNQVDAFMTESFSLKVDFFPAVRSDQKQVCVYSARRENFESTYEQAMEMCDEAQQIESVVNRVSSNGNHRLLFVSSI